MSALNDIRERMEVVDVSGLHVGFVEAVEAEAIRLVRADPDPAAEHHRIPIGWVAGVGQTVRLSRGLKAVSERWA
jgi:hypothetical protein